MKAVIMAGGKGTRLQTLEPNIPKPMVRILDKPILEYQIESLIKCNVTEIIIIIGHLGNAIQEYFGDGSKWRIFIKYMKEEQPLGTAGSLYYLKEEMDEDFFLVFGDLILDIDWKRFMDFHQKKMGLITLYGHPNDHPFDSDVLVVDKNSRVINIEYKNMERCFCYHNFVNAGIYCISPKALESISTPIRLDLEKELIAAQLIKGTVYAYRSTEYVKDMGTPKRYFSVIEDVRKGLVSDRSLKKKQKCIFLDRDGTINQLNGFLNSSEQLSLLPGAAEAIKKINESSYLAIVVTNQPVIARGECTIETLDEIHKKMETILGCEGAYIDDLFFCPHHPDKGYEGEVSELKIECNCRKPKIGMLLQAAKKYNIDLRNSWFIGDTTIDIQTGINAGTHTVLVHTGEAGMDGKYNAIFEYEAENLNQAVDAILTLEK